MNILSVLKSVILDGRSYKWPNLREQHLKKQPFCMACGSTANLQVHHIEPVHVNPDRELDPNNLITLCGKNCHFIFGHLMDYSSWNTRVVEDSQVYLNNVKNRPYKLKSMSESNNLFSNFYRSLSWLIH